MLSEGAHMLRLRRRFAPAPLSMTQRPEDEAHSMVYTPFMMNALSILNQNSDFVMNAYNMSALMGGIFLISLIDFALKGWAMWRAAQLKKKHWFIALLVINSMGILPIIFLLITREEYEKQKRSLATKNIALEM